VKVKNVPKVPHLAPNLPTMIPPTNVGSEPIYPTPLGNGSWDGILAGQMDGGTVAIYKKGATSPSLIGWMVESNNGTAGHESWFIDDGFPEPTVGNPIIVGSRNYTTSAGIGTPVDLSEPSGSNLEWNLLREAATYYSVSFPNDP
jgi:hypothetical protein